MNKIKKRMKPMAFIRKYGRIMIGGSIILVVLFVAIFAHKLSSYDPYLTYPYDKFLSPGSAGHPLGTDAWGRDLLTQLFYGARMSLIIPFGVQAATLVLGTIVGLVCGYYPKADMIISRIMEALHAIPMLVLALIICEVLGKGIFNLIISLSVGGTISVARIIRGKVLSLRKEEFIECEKVMGASELRTLVFHILPSCLNTLLVSFSSGLAGTLLGMVGLAFLSVGIDVSIPSWGLSVALGRSYFILMPYMTLYPALAIIITTFAFSMIGDGMREVIGSGRS